MQPSPISLLIKRDFVIFERVPMAQPGFELGTFHLEGESLIHYSIKEVMLILKVVLYIFDHKGAELVGHDLF